jgi:hypothetical protein
MTKLFFSFKNEKKRGRALYFFFKKKKGKKDMLTF